MLGLSDAGRACVTWEHTKVVRAATERHSILFVDAVIFYGVYAQTPNFLQRAGWQKLQGLIRQHWSIENQCHWILDVTFDEDQCRSRKGHAAANLAMLRKVVLSLLKNDTTIKDSVRGKRYRAALDENTLEKILFPQDSK